MGQAYKFIPFILSAALLVSCGKSGTEDPFGGSGSGSGSGSGMSEQREALIKIYNAAEGDGWYMNTNWCTDVPVGQWFGVTADENGNVTKLTLNKNNMTGVLPDVFDKLPKLVSLNVSDNNLSGKIPSSLAFMPEASFAANFTNNEFETTTIKVPNDRIERVGTAFRVYPQSKGNEGFRFFADSEVDGTGEIHPHLSAVQYQTHTEGAGVDLIIVGEGYDAEECTVGGSADYWYKVAAEAFFDIEPYTKLRKYFDVWFIYVHSEDKGVTLYTNDVEDKRNTPFRYTSKDGCSITTSLCGRAVMDAMGRPMKDSTTVQVCVNSTHNALSGGKELRAGSLTWNGYTVRGCGYGICQQRPTAFRGLVKHETGGHAFGGLNDEYTGSRTADDIPTYQAAITRSPNIDTQPNPGLVKWARFISDQRYAGEDIGVYPGGLQFTVTSGVYRPSKTSMMYASGERSNFYNAPGRWNIYHRVMRKAFPPDCATPYVRDYETFVKFDLNLE